MLKNEYVNLIRSGTLQARSRVIVTRAPDALSDIRQWYRNLTDARLVGMHEFVATRDWYPMPDIIFRSLKERVRTENEAGKVAVLVGFDGYTSLLSTSRRQDAYAGLQSFVDDNSLHAIFLVWEKKMSGLSGVFAHPKYTSGKQLIMIDDGAGTLEASPPLIYLVDDKWFLSIPPDVQSFCSYLKKYENETLGEHEIKIAVQSRGDYLAGMHDGIMQVTTLGEYLRIFHGVTSKNLSEGTLQWIFSLIQNNQTSAVEKIAAEHFSIHDDICTNILYKFSKCSTEEREAFLWVAGKYAPAGSYLKRVIDIPEYTVNKFIQHYVTSAKNFISEKNVASMVNERKKAIRELNKSDYRVHISSFIDACRGINTRLVAAWLNVETEEEKEELLRRLGLDSIPDERRAIEKAYPEVEAYLNTSSVFEEPVLDAYFKEYRLLKIAGRTTEEFGAQARNVKIPAGTKSRDVLIQALRHDQGTALLVVDAMGAEYLPMLTALAQRAGLGIRSVNIGSANLPTTTKFNPIEWPEERKLLPIKQLDNIGHAGAEAHVTLPPETSLRAELDVMSEVIIATISLGLKQFERVLVTADHGASRLAVCAWQQGLAQTLKVSAKAEVLDWRYMYKLKDEEQCPSELEETLDGKFWVVRGYNRLPKSGGKIFELHGGATLEECLVPVIVFERDTPLSKKIAAPLVSPVELIEKGDFADL